MMLEHMQSLALASTYSRRNISWKRGDLRDFADCFGVTAELSEDAVKYLFGLSSFGETGGTLLRQLVAIKSLMAINLQVQSDGSHLFFLISDKADLGVYGAVSAALEKFELATKKPCVYLIMEPCAMMVRVG
jgi:hypothetical protein